MMCGILSQILAGYYNFELLQYFKELYVITFPQVIMFSLLAFFVQTVVSNKFVGHGIVIGVFLLETIMDTMGLSDRLYMYGRCSALHLLRHERLRPLRSTNSVVFSILAGVGIVSRSTREPA
jgi:hypothetical protein